MKKIYFTLLATIVSMGAFATTHLITNSGFTYTPASLTITQGDTVQFMVGSFHPTLEVDMATYNANGSTGNGGFSVPSGNGIVFSTFTTPGTYYYVCTDHVGSGMKGTITVNAAPPPPGAVWINEIHYDNAGSDVDEGVEIAGAAGTDLSCYSLMLYNGNDSELYGNNDSIVLTGSIDDEGCGYGAVWFGLPANGLQNGSPDGIGLYNHCTSSVVQFLSYEGVIASAGDGPMIGLASEDIGVVEGFAHPVGGSLQLMGIGTAYADFTWDSTGVNSYDVLNPNQSLCGAPTDTVVSFNTTTGSTLEGAGTFALDLKLNQATSADVTVDVNITSGATADITNTFPESVTFTAGNTTASLTLNLLDDAVIEPNATYTFILENAPGLVLGSDSIFTLTVNDDDTPLPEYTIATVRGADTDGQADSIGVDCKLFGTVLGVNYSTGMDMTFYIHDGTAGIGVYIPTSQNTFGYTIEEGDSISISGTIGQFRGLSQIIDPIALDSLATGSTIPTPTAVTDLDESTESELVVLNNVTIVDQADWGTTVSGGYDVEVTDGTNTFLVRIDNDTELFGTALPGCVLDVTGIGSQFSGSSTAPFADGYRLLPRFNSDINVIDTCAPPVILDRTIDQVNDVNGSGEADSLGLKVRVTGFVNSPDRGFMSLEFSMQDAGAGITVFTNDPAYDALTLGVGDEVEVVGTVAQDVGVIRLESIESINVLSSGNTVSEVVSTTLDDINESTLIRYNDLRIINSGDWTAVGGAGFNVPTLNNNNDTIVIRIDRDYADLYNSSAPSSDTIDVIGVVGQFDPSTPFDEGYQLIPRFLTDVIEHGGVGINDFALNNFKVSPIPTSNFLNISFEYDANETATVQLVNVIGKVVSTKSVSLISGLNTESISVANLTSGMYTLRIQTSHGSSNTNVLVK